MASHDPLFKRLLQRFFADFLRLVAPDVAERLELSAAVFLDKEFSLPEVPGSRVVDLLARVPLLTDRGRFLLVHVEIEARARKGMGERLRDYHHRILTRHGGQVLSVAVYLRGGPGGVQEQVLEEDLAGPGLLTFRFLSFGLERSSAAEYLGRPEPLAWALASLMDRRPWSRARLKMSCLQRTEKASLDDSDRSELVNCIETYLQLTPGEDEEIAKLGVPARRRAQTMLHIESWADRMMAQGARRVVLGLLERHFGPISEEVRKRIEGIRSIERLTRLAERVPTARSLQQIGLG